MKRAFLCTTPLPACGRMKLGKNGLIWYRKLVQESKYKQSGSATGKLYFRAMKIGYARVSTRDQNLELQLDALNKAGCELIYQEKVLGAIASRPELDKLLSRLRPGDTVYIYKLDRLGRSLRHLLTVVSDLQQLGVGLVSLTDAINTASAQGRLVFNLFASLAEFERELIRERTHAGLAAARARQCLRIKTRTLQ